MALGQKWVYDRRWGPHVSKWFYSNRPPTLLDVPHDEEMQEALRALERGPLPPDEVERMQRIGDHIYGRHKPKFKEVGDAKDVEAGVLVS